MSIIKRVKSMFSKMEHIDKIMHDNIIRQSYHNLYLTSKVTGVSNERYPEGELIISLTSYGDKLQLLYLTIESLLQQTLKPNKILLWLDEKKYSDKGNIPLSLLRQTERGLEIKLCEDIRSYTKLIHTIVNYPEAITISVDDDILYPIDFVERLYKAYKNDCSKIYFYRGHKILFDSNGKPKPYLDWVKKGAEGCDIYNFPTGVSGVLYPPKCYHEDMTKKELFLQLCPYADDVWFKVMTMLKGVQCELINSPHYEKLFIPLDIEEMTSLQKINVQQGMNDVQIREVFEYYNLIK